MCGRYVTPEQAAIERAWHIGRHNWQDWFRPSFNVAPSAIVPIVKQAEDGVWEGFAARWGLVPAWWKKDTLPSLSFNARSEEAAQKPLWRQSLRGMRCIMPARGWYEWCETEPVLSISGRQVNQPWFIHSPGEDVVAIAGLWSAWRGTEGQSLMSCALMTREAAPGIAAVHHRMPVILAGQQIAEWLDPALDERGVQALIATAQGNFRAHRVSTRVNSPRHDDAGLLDEVPAANAATQIGFGFDD